MLVCLGDNPVSKLTSMLQTCGANASVSRYGFKKGQVDIEVIAIEIRPNNAPPQILVVDCTDMEVLDSISKYSGLTVHPFI